MNDAIKLAIDALEAACGNRCNAEYNPCQAREAIEALRAQPETGLTPINDLVVVDGVVMHKDDAAQPDHSELITRLRTFDFHGTDTDYWIETMDEAADALENL